MPARQGHPFAIVLPLSAIVVTIALVLNARAEVLRSQAIPATPAAHVAIEHAVPLTLTLTMSAGKRDGIVEIVTEAPTGPGTGVAETAAVSVPSSWERREVRGAALDAVRGDPLSMGFTRWHVPPGVTVSFRMTDVTGITIQNPTAVPLLVIAKRVNVVTGEVLEKSILIQDQATSLW